MVRTLAYSPHFPSYRFARFHTLARQSQACTQPATPNKVTLRRPNLRIPNLSKIKGRKNITTTTTTDVLCLMDSLQLPVPEDIYAYLLKECTDSRDPIRGSEVHAHINRSDLQLGLPLANRLLLMYVSCDRLDAAQNLFDKMPVRSSISWVTMIAGYVHNDEPRKALWLFFKMPQRTSLESTGLVVVSVLKACFQTGEFGLGKQVHGWVLKIGFGKDLFLGSAFVDFYTKFGCLEGARFVFEQICRRDTVLWTAMIGGYCRVGKFVKVMDLFKDMGREGVKKNNFTMSSALRACGRIMDDGHLGRQVHASAIKLGVEMDLYVMSSLVDMYGRCGLLSDARRAFEIVGNQRNEVCWNAMLTGYLQKGFYDEGIKLMYQMKAAGLQPQDSMLKKARLACGD
ncbi:pentatricopeptide repeat-containing protein At1g31790-like [Telopea speciosissima]|uniref:pentatricopeptide repeat-containing protein At1g31790-like n=1 Tax=Telopea speciosissima TaxID=54955 RepID=UPI001CC5D47A|nr:pentatricopeptide repeat-containing protein At1g31790-like [Telopea speciosissima]